MRTEPTDQECEATKRVRRTTRPEVSTEGIHRGDRAWFGTEFEPHQSRSGRTRHLWAAQGGKIRSLTPRNAPFP